jgi:hypothetical protein
MKSTAPQGSLAISAQNVSEVSMRSGGKIITGTTEVTGKFGAIQALSATVVAAATTVSPGKLVGTMAALPIPAGTTIFGNFTSITLTSGTVIAYNQP